MDFFSEFGEDYWLAIHGKLPERGFYVDCGCYSPTIASNTAHFRGKGWAGIAIDANPAMAKEWTRYPGKFINALIGDGRPAKYEVNGEKPAWSRAGSGPEIPTLTLNSIMEAEGVTKIDLLSIDLEGMEYDALLTLNLDLYQPQAIVAEYDTAGIGKDFRVLEHLIKGDYAAVHRTEANIIYLRVKKQKFNWPPS